MSAKRAETATVNITLRVKEGLRDSLEKAARAHGVSLNTEIADRLEHARDRQSLLMEVLTLAYGRELAGILVLVGAAMTVAGQLQAGGDWTADPHAYDDAVLEAARVLEALRPGGAPPKVVDQMVWAHAFQIVHQFAGPNPPERIASLISKFEEQWERRKKAQK
jgi:hypothetical protein